MVSLRNLFNIYFNVELFFVTEMFYTIYVMY